uniref:Uncharacterized protein n=1 Tax=Pyxicephalus adspersus TaxID=30357 RepID=A0AAV3A7Y4_PYXAD|nr:TPA: hypothetical protein GDO54_012925 [Pyxicephalus adspersus]
MNIFFSSSFFLKESAECWPCSGGFGSMLLIRSRRHEAFLEASFIPQGPPHAGWVQRPLLLKNDFLSVALYWLGGSLGAALCTM